MLSFLFFKIIAVSCYFISHFVAKKIKISYNETNIMIIFVDNKKGVDMKKNKFFYRIRVFFLVFLFILPCFSLLACSGGGGGSGSGGNGLFGDGKGVDLSHFENRNIDLSADNFKLIDCCGTVNVASNEKRSSSHFFEMESKFTGMGGLT